jgi:biotin transport system substrate-specific component
MGEVFFGALTMWLSASFSLLYVFSIPITLQTCAVQILSLFFVPRVAFLSVGLWILLGVLGVHCFASRQSGLCHVMGLRGGYIWGCLCAAPMIALLHQFFSSRGWRQWSSFSLSSFLGHILILFFGWLFVFCKMGAYDAWIFAVRPFVLFIFVKTIPFSLFLSCLQSFFAPLFISVSSDNDSR